MAAGLAIVTTTAGANADAIDDGKEGLFVPPGDHQALADAILTLLDQPVLRRRCAAIQAPVGSASCWSTWRSFSLRSGG